MSNTQKVGELVEFIEFKYNNLTYIILPEEILPFDDVNVYCFEEESYDFIPEDVLVEVPTSRKFLEHFQNFKNEYLNIMGENRESQESTKEKFLNKQEKCDMKEIYNVENNERLVVIKTDDETYCNALTDKALDTIKWMQGKSIIDYETTIFIPEDKDFEDIPVVGNDKASQCIVIDSWDKCQNDFTCLNLTQEQVAFLKWLLNRGCFNDNIEWIIPEKNCGA